MLTIACRAAARLETHSEVNSDDVETARRLLTTNGFGAGVLK